MYGTTHLFRIQLPRKFHHLLPLQRMIRPQPGLEQLGAHADAPIHPLDILAHLDIGKIPIHAALQLLRVARHGTVDVAQLLAQLLGRVEAGGAAGHVGFEDVFCAAAAAAVFWLLLGLAWAYAILHLLLHRRRRRRRCFLLRPSLSASSFLGEQQQEILVHVPPQRVQQFGAGHGIAARPGGDDLARDEVLQHGFLAVAEFGVVDREHGRVAQREVGARQEGVKLADGGADARFVVDAQGDGGVGLEDLPAVLDALRIGPVHQEEVDRVEALEG